MPNAALLVIVVLAGLWLLGWLLACLIDVTVARWPEVDATRYLLPPAPVRWARLLYLWPLSLSALFPRVRRRTR